MEKKSDLHDYVVSVGAGKYTLVFLHYFGGSAKSWSWLIDLLSKEFRCVALNLPGFGNTEIHHEPSVEYYATFVQDALNAVNISSYILIGHSMSGKIAVEMAAQGHGKAMQQLILLAPSPPAIERMPEAEKERMLNHPNKKVAEDTVRKIIVKPISSEQFETAVVTQLEIDETVWRWWINTGMNTPLRHDTKHLNGVPVTVVTSADDPCITLKMIHEDVLPNLPEDVKLITCAGIGHLYPMEDAEWLAEVIRSEVVSATADSGQ